MSYGGEAEAVAAAPNDSPLRSPSSWARFERFNTSFERIALGWQQLDAHEAAHEVSQALGSEVDAVEKTTEPGRLFIVGNIGYIGKSASERSEYLPATVKKIWDSLGLMGDFKIDQAKPSLAGNFVRISQDLNRLPIYGAQFAVHSNAEGLAYAMVGTPAPKGLKVRVRTRKIRPEEAAEVIAQVLETTTKELAYRPEEILLPVDEELQPCYLIRAIARRPFGDWQGFVDFDGNLLALFNIASAAIGQASGYKVNPHRSPAVQALQLTDLQEPPESLTGQKSEVWCGDQTRVSSQTGNFVFDPNQREFDEPQLYYFLQFCRNSANGFVEGKLAEQLMAHSKFNPMKASVHVQEAPNNAMYMPDNGQLYFGDSTDDARYSSRSLDLVLHEFGHAISDSICHLGRARPHDSSRAMSEGFSDYFAATVLNDPIIGEYFVPGDPRSCENQRKFPRSFVGEEHDVGNVWAGLLWDLRQEAGVGQAVADALMLQSLSFLGPWRTIPQGVEALVQSDRVLFPEHNHNKGRHEDVIQEVFKNRKQ
jgi:Zn-dependent metalloprotease